MHELLKLIVTRVAWVWLAVVALTASAADEIPVTLIVQGVIANSADGTIVLAEDDVIQALSGNARTGTVEGEGSADAGGAYGVIISKTSAFKGTLLYLRLKRGTSTYQLLNTGGTPATVAFTGASFFPTTMTKNLVATSTVLTSPGTTTPGTTPPGTTTSGTTASGTTTSGTTTSGITPSGITPSGTTPSGTTPSGTTPSGTTPSKSLIGDINGDGKVDDADIVLLKKAISGEGSIVKSTMDITADGVVNSRDLIELISSVRKTSAIATLKTTSSSSNGTGTSARIELIRAERDKLRVNFTPSK